MKSRFFQPLLLGFALILQAGCVRSSPSLDPSLSLGPPFEWKTNQAFRNALRSESGSQASERARIDYLLERVSKSPYNFFRNEDRYNGKKSALQLKWKYFQNRGRVKTAEEFINQLTYSKRTGRPYLVELPKNGRRPMRLVLLSELRAFDQALERERKRLSELTEVESKEPPS